ncbi:MAG: phosphotransferase [Anaerolineae bacterium]|jgi:aminoglycoside phosphotransferase (APT) family kinase protein
MRAFKPNEYQARCEKYLSHCLDGGVRLLHAEQLVRSTRDAPWRLDVEVDGRARSYVLRLDSRGIEHEFEVLRAMESVAIPTPRAYGWDPEGKALGVRCFFYEFVEGESLLAPMLAGEPWAEALYIDTACALQAVTREQLATVAHRFGRDQTGKSFLKAAREFFKANPHPVAAAAYAKLKDTMPPLPAVRFSNGDLWPDNLIVRDQQLVGIIDWTNAGFTDPIYEFLLPFFVRPELRGRGLEERYCRLMGFDPAALPWYRGLEYFDTWHWVLKTGEPFEHYTVDRLAAALTHWLDHGPAEMNATGHAK